MPAMRPGFDHALVSAVPLSIAAAMVIAEPVLYEIVYNLRLGLTFAGKCQQRVITMRPRRGHARPWLGADVGVGHRDSAAGPDGARLFQRLRAIEAAADRRRRRHSAVRARAPAPIPAVSAASGK